METNGKMMRAFVLAGPALARVERAAVPDPQGREVRVRIEGCGLCGSNLPPWEGRPWFKYPFVPGAPGHEGWGYVDALGPGARNLRVGQRVALLSYQAFAEYDLAQEDSAVPLPETLKGKAFPGEALGCAFNVVKRCAFEPGQMVAIIGIGFLGAVITALAARAGATVIAISRRPFALELAQAFGAAQTIPMDDHSRIVHQVMNLTGGKGCDRVVEAVGQQWPLELAGELTRERGMLIIAGYHQDGPRQVNMQLWNWRGLDVVNAHERDSRVYAEGMRAAVASISRGEVDPTPLYTHRFALDEIPHAFEAARERPDRFLKAVVAV